MGKGRLEAFTDAVLAIIMTIMVLNLKIPRDAGITSLKSLIPDFLGYGLSFTYIGIYWNNHHHMFQAAKIVSGAVLWANLFLLFWLSLIPFVTGWVGENHFAKWPVVCYGALLIISSIAYFILARTLVRHHGKDSLLAEAFGGDVKGKITVGLYAVAIGLSFFYPLLGFGLYGLIACIWFVPDKRIEKTILNKRNSGK